MTSGEDAHRPSAKSKRTPSSTTKTVVGAAASSFALPLSALVTSPILARSLGPEIRGELAAVLAPIAFATLIATVGIPEALTFFVASRRRQPLKFAATGAIIGGAAGVIAASVLIVLAPILLSHSPQYVTLLRSIALLVPVFLAGAALRGALQGKGNFNAVNVERWLSVSSRVVLIVGLALAGGLTVSSAAWVTNATAAFALLVLLAAVIRWRRKIERTGDTGSVWTPLLGYGMRVWPGAISMLMSLRADQVVMAPIVSPQQLGYYAVAVAVAEVPWAGFGALRDVIFSRSTQRGESTLIAVASRLCLIVFVPAVIIGIVLMPWAMRFVFGPEFSEATIMAQILLVASLPAGLATICGAGLMSLGRPGALSVTQAVASILSVGFVLLLTPEWGGLGAACASLLSYVILFAVTLTLFCRESGTRLRTVLLPTRQDAAFLRSRFLTRRSPTG